MILLINSDSVEFYNVETKETKRIIGTECRDFIFNHDNTQISMLCRDGIYITDIETNERILEIYQEDEKMISQQYSHDSKYLAIYFKGGDKECNYIKVIEISTGVCIKRLFLTTSSFTFVAGTNCICTSNFYKIYFDDFLTNETIKEIKISGCLTKICSNSDSSVLCGVLNDSSRVVFFNFESGSVLYVKDFMGDIINLEFKNNILLVVTENKIYLFDIISQTEIYTSEYSETMSLISLSTNGDFLVYESNDYICIKNIYLNIEEKLFKCEDCRLPKYIQFGYGTYI